MAQLTFKTDKETGKVLNFANEKGSLGFDQDEQGKFIVHELNMSYQSFVKAYQTFDIYLLPSGEVEYREKKRRAGRKEQ